MTLFVLDASVALSWVFVDEHSEYSDHVSGALTSSGAVVPVIWTLEVTNAIAAAVRRGRVDELLAYRMQRTLDSLPLEIDTAIALSRQGQRLLQRAIDSGLSAYDASYLDLALSRDLPLATQDARLARTAERAGVTILRP